MPRIRHIGADGRRAGSTVWRPRKIVSGGQTGVDRAVLDVALDCGMDVGGWCPKGRWAEDGVIAERYSLAATPSADPAQRTSWNVRDSDATLVVAAQPGLSPGTELTVRLAKLYDRPLLVVSSGDADGVVQLRTFLEEHRVEVLNVAGPRASECERSGGVAARLLEGLLA